jgi:hypothetical protein
MSKRKNRARAEAGIIFRDGHYVNKEEWYAKKSALALEKLLTITPAPQESPAAVLETAKIGAPYFCGKCNKWHRTVGATYNAHKEFAKEEIA